MQFYDTPRSLKETTENMSAKFSGPFANYDMPKEGPPMPVFRKPCGCIMKLVKENQGKKPALYFKPPLLHYS